MKAEDKIQEILNLKYFSNNDYFQIRGDNLTKLWEEAQKEVYEMWEREKRIREELNS